MADDCCNSFGGVITIQAGNQRLSARGDITIMPAGRSVEGGSNGDGTDFFTAKPTQVGWDATLSIPCDADLVALFKTCTVNVTIDEVDNGRQHLFTGGRIVGEMSQNLSSGEVSGLTGRGGRYRRI